MTTRSSDRLTGDFGQGPAARFNRGAAAGTYRGNPGSVALNRRNRRASGVDWRGERGAALVFVAVSLIVLLGIMALAIDLGMLYVARNDAQRAADAAALAGAKAFANSACSVTYSCGPTSPSQAIALEQAQSVGEQNYILGQAANIPASDVVFHYPHPNEPQVTAIVTRTGIPTIFARILGQSSATVSATATAEAYYEPASDLLPFVVANCDPPPQAAPPQGAGTNPSCATYSSSSSYASVYTAYPFIIGSGSTATVSTWAIGQSLQLHCSSCGSATPSQFYMIDYEPNDSANVIGNEVLSDVPISEASCYATLSTADGSKVGKVIPTIDQRIYASAQGPNNGQDTLVSAVPLLIQVGSNNPDYDVIMRASNGTGQYPGPDSATVTVPIYEDVVSGGQPLSDGSPSTALSPGGGNQVQVAGYLQLFIVDTSQKAVNAIITGISPCTGNAYADVPIRLIQAPTP